MQRHAALAVIGERKQRLKGIAVIGEREQRFRDKEERERERTAFCLLIIVESSD